MKREREGGREGERREYYCFLFLGQKCSSQKAGSSFVILLCCSHLGLSSEGEEFNDPISFIICLF